MTKWTMTEKEYLKSSFQIKKDSNGVLSLNSKRNLVTNVISNHEGYYRI